jgi:hypothetical protein
MTWGGGYWSWELGGRVGGREGGRGRGRGQRGFEIAKVGFMSIESDRAAACVSRV